MLQRIAFGASLVAALALAGTAIAGKGAATKSSWISDPVVVSPSSPSSTTASGPRYGDVVAFTVSTNQTSNPFVNVRCYQNGTLVLSGWSAFFAGGLGDRTFGLASAAWQSGAADCTADLDMYSNGRWKVLASTSFHVDA
jgi:hypothetical protein